MDADDDTDLFNGTHEMEMCESEADLALLKQNCKKNPGHPNFIPPKQFTARDLPVGYHDDDVCTLIKAIAKVTVLLEVSYVSEERPETYPDTDTAYPSYKDKGSRLIRVGTGRVDQVTMHTSLLCPCTICEKSGNRKTEWGEIEVHTATHVVFDDTEAANTTCSFFYEDGADEKKIPKCRNTYVAEAKIPEDRCRVIFFTCDLELLKELDARRLEWRDICIKVNKKYSAGAHRLTVIVSHPHGQGVHISLGEWTHKKDFGETNSKYVYNTSTCPGSSGAQVCVLGSYDSWWCNHVHSGTDRLGRNYSTMGRDLNVPLSREKREPHGPRPRPDEASLAPRPSLDDIAPPRKRRFALYGLDMYYKSMEIKRPIAPEDYDHYVTFSKSKRFSSLSAVMGNAPLTQIKGDTFLGNLKQRAALFVFYTFVELLIIFFKEGSSMI